MQFVRFGMLGLVVLSVIYFLVSVYSRSIRREWLEGEWAEEPREDRSDAARAAFIEAGMAKYEAGFRKKLILLIYVIPTVLIGILGYVIN